MACQQWRANRGVAAESTASSANGSRPVRGRLVRSAGSRAGEFANNTGTAASVRELQGTVAAISTGQTSNRVVTTKPEAVGIVLGPHVQHSFQM